MKKQKPPAARRGPKPQTQRKRPAKTEKHVKPGVKPAAKPKTELKTAEIDRDYIGRVQIDDGVCYLTALGKTPASAGLGLVYAPKDKTKGAVNGHIVTYRITAQASAGRMARGEVVSLVGHAADPGVDVLAVVQSYNMPSVFPAEVLTEAEATPERVGAGDIKRRTDYRKQMAITIDGADAKDLDDAVCLEETPDGWRLYVHIADVAHYVPRGGAMDREAYNRGTSAYLADRVIPMLPHKLSNGICSLNAGVDRLALTCVMDISGKGWITASSLQESVINVKERMTYDGVLDILENPDSPIRERYAHVAPMLAHMETLSNILRNNRRRRGALELTSSECVFTVDENGRPTDIRRSVPNTATGIIEEFMILCNETVAGTLSKANAPYIYRTHEEPDPDKALALFQLAKGLGIKTRAAKPGKGPISSKSIQALLDAAGNTPYNQIINRAALITMRQARYTAGNTGHFGLASRCYCHFTSPIRRYPDLWDHRVVKAYIHGKLSGDTNAKAKPKSKSFESVCLTLSMYERRAMTVEREVESMKKVQFMEDKVGSIYNGVISGVKSWGMYVELDNTVEGLVTLRSMDDDYYLVSESEYLVYGQRTRKVYRLGDAVTVRVAAVDTELKRLDFVLEKYPGGVSSFVDIDSNL